MSFLRVIDEIFNNFHREDVKLERFPLLPYGILVRDRLGNTVVFFFDIKTKTVKWVFPDKAANRVPSNSD